MAIDIDPTAVLAAADAVDSASRSLSRAVPPGLTGNDGFQFSRAMARFATDMARDSAKSGADLATTATNLESSAKEMRHTDEQAQIRSQTTSRRAE